MKSINLLFKLFLFSFVIGSASLAFLIFHYSRDLPDYKQLAEYNPPAVTRFYSFDGIMLEQYSSENRVFVPLATIPQHVVNAFISAEDKNFFEHSGIDFIGLIRASIQSFINLAKGGRVEGASTITQQVTRHFLLTNERTLSRKFKEIILSFMISKTYSKEKILEIYLNEIYLGRKSYGVAAAALAYFDKSINELNLEEAALLAIMPKAPSLFDPERNPARAKSRRDWVIEKMLENNYISEKAAYYAKINDIKVGKRKKARTFSADYYAEEVRKEVVEILGEKKLYEGGLTVITNLDSRLQNYAKHTLRNHIEKYNKKHGYKGPISHFDNIDNWQEQLKEYKFNYNKELASVAVILEIAENQAVIGLKNGNTANIYLKDASWAKAKLQSFNELLQVGDVILAQKQNSKYSLYQIPKVNGAIFVMKPDTGQVLAMEGGYNSAADRFNRATQALRQTGSIFKPFVYLAALEEGYTPSSIFTDEPVEIDVGPNQELWSPKNYNNDYLGDLPLRVGLEKSRNIITVQIARAIGLKKILDVTKRFGIHDNPPAIYSIVLGAVETTLDKMTNAYAMMVNGGKQTKPSYIEAIFDRNGKLIYKRSSGECHNCHVSEEYNSDEVAQPYIFNNHKRVTDRESSYQVNKLLQSAVKRGSSWRAKVLGNNVGGKTGTTNNSFDTWYVGFNSEMVVGVYLGFDQPKTLGKHAAGANTALPVFVDFMRKAIKLKPSREFNKPKNINMIKVDPITGLASNEGDAILMPFKLGSEPFTEQHKQKIIIDNNQNSLYSPDLFGGVY